MSEQAVLLLKQRRREEVVVIQAEAMGSTGEIGGVLTRVGFRHGRLRFHPRSTHPFWVCGFSGPTLTLPYPKAGRP